jgi:hypothetical protein
MTTDQMISAASCFCAFLAALATFMTVSRIASQQRASYRPELAFSRVCFKASPKDTKKLLTQWADVRDKKAPAGDLHLLVPLTNIGLATAKDVSLRWTFPFAAAVQQANELAQNALVPVHFEIVKNSGMLVVHLDDMRAHYAAQTKYQQTESFDYVLPVSIEPTRTLVTVPSAYILLVSAIIYIKKMESYDTLPPINVSLEFADIAGNRYKSSFRYKIGLTFFSGSNDPASPDFLAKGCLEPQKIR